MKVSCVQFRPILGAPSENIRRMTELCPHDADLVVFPEMATSGYVFAKRDDLMDVAESENGAACSTMSDIASAYNCHLIYGFPERAGDILYNSAAVVGPNGLVCVYRKAHLFAAEPDFFAPGQDPWPVLDLAGVKVGIMICFDWFFPEVARCMALAGAELIAHPSNLVLPYCQNAMLTRSLENRVFTATCNRIGNERAGVIDYTFTGQSQITGPGGERLAQASTDEESVISATIDPKDARIKLAGPGVALFDRRRPELYGRLTETD